MQMSFDNLIKTAIREHAKRDHDGFYLRVDHIPLTDLKIILSNLIPADEYAYAVQSKVRLQAYVAEFRDDIQHAINDMIDDTYHEYMNDSGFYTNTCSNGDVLWIKR